MVNTTGSAGVAVVSLSAELLGTAGGATGAGSTGAGVDGDGSGSGASANGGCVWVWLAREGFMSEPTSASPKTIRTQNHQFFQAGFLPGVGGATGAV
ncbi:MAG: hypothetical protein LBE08_03140 [Bifidobacteriaceae bacterium]|nr:hypothetical protein [Bifidobacteriaceae bacterium]